MHSLPSAVKRKKISIWILHGSSGITFEFNPLKLAVCAVVFCLALTTAAVFIGRTFLVGGSENEHQLTEVASATLLEQYLKQRASYTDHAALEHQTPLNKAATPGAIWGDASANAKGNPALDAKIKLLVDEFVRVRSYEKQLQTRAGLLENILHNVLDLDEGYFVSGAGADDSLEERPERANQNQSEDLGIGGSEEPISPLFENYSPVQLKDVARVPMRPVTLSELDAQFERLNTLPLGTPVLGVKSSKFGPRFSPFSKRYHLHSGLDIAVDRESTVTATGDGVIVTAGEKGAYGRLVVIDHGNGLETLYGHLAKIVVKEGQKVCRGQQIGFVGSSGRSTGPHLHYEVRVDGTPRDPEPFVKLASVLRAFDSDS